jgi:threonyl-tRNA synthetase
MLRFYLAVLFAKPPFSDIFAFLKNIFMIQITLPDGSVKEVAKDSSPFDVARNISEGLARAIISAKFNDTVVETSTPLTTDGTLVLYTFDNPEGKKAFWHSSAHVLAQAVQELYPGVKLTIGPGD